MGPIQPLIWTGYRQIGSFHKPCLDYGQPEYEIPPSSNLYNEAISAGEQITREDYFRD